MHKHSENEVMDKATRESFHELKEGITNPNEEVAKNAEGAR